jgi:hypothetical protein
LRQEQVALVNALRDITGAPLDELLQMVNSGLGIAVSRATLNRYLKPASANRRARRCREKGAEGRHRAAKAAVASSALSLHMDDGGEQHLLWAREPVSGWCYARLYAGISPQLLAHWTNALLEPVRLIYNLLRLLVLR